ncbi:nitrate- and nitrite sensing domain-containing protein [Streptomyces sp. NPDC090442]|uniref:sensor histidine kinase n=1 Tax=Streptomyces sp. NPDC090442 TaxID=3365962 RepID=UPI003830EE67
MRRSTTSPEPQEPRRGNFTPPPRGGTAPAADAPAPPAENPQVSGSKYAPRNWRVATRLNAILLIPVLVGLVFGGLRVNNSLGTWQDARDAENTAKLVRAALSYSNALIDERDRTVAPLLKGRKDDPTVQEARDATDAAGKAFHEAAKSMPDTPGLQRRMGLFQKTEPKLAQLRQVAFTAKLTGVQTEEGYVEIQHPLMEFANELGLGTGNITSYGRTVYAVSLAKAAESLERSIGTHLLVDPASPQGGKEHKTQLTAFASYRYLEGIAIGEYTSGGTPEDVQRLKGDAAGLQRAAQAQTDRAKSQAEAAGQQFRTPPSMDQMSTLIASGAAPDALAAKGVTPDAYFRAATGKFDMYRSIEKDLADKAVNEAAQISSDAKWSIFVDSGIVLAALAAAFIVAGLMARRMSRNMQALRNAAFGVAEQRLPMLVDQLSRTEPGRVDTRVTPIPIATTDEIGEVARAFDQVHREAVRLAAEQALLRGNVNAIFTNLSRRNQGLIERQLELITGLENNEADPDQLENLFRLDHLATRMRRNGENLLILAGEEPGSRWNQPVPLIDVLRAATSEVESYERIELSGVPESEIHGTAVTDLVHLLSELLENATTFSSPQTKVRVAATRLPDGRVMIEIHDKGIGLTPEDFADINDKLANPPSVDAAVSQRMGLFVVGRLADRHGIRVQLRPSGEQAGTTSLVMLPEAITHGGGGDEQFDDTFTVSRIVPEHQQATYQDDARTAAELGFDDGLQGAAGPAAELDPVGRSLLREERRAALEAQAAAGQPAPQQADTRPLFRDEVTDGFQGHPAPYAEPGQPLYDDRSYGGEAFAAPNPMETTGQYPYAPQDAGHVDGWAPQESDRVDGWAPWETGQVNEWAEPTAHQGYFGSEAESDRNPTAAPADASERVTFERPGPSASTVQSLTDAGLPLRGTDSPQDQQQTAPESGQDDGSAWRSENDERWQRAERLRQPSAGGVTASGLPRRVPKANLVEGTAEQTTQGGPQVSRAPEDVRGRLSNLRRGVQQGRGAGTGTDPSPGVPQNDQQGFGPGSTYDQER